MPYWRLFYHVVWSTRERESLIDEPVAAVVMRSLKSTCAELHILVHAIGIMPDHVHMAISIPPSLAVAAIVGRLNGAASHAVSAADVSGEASFGWQAEYGALSFGEKALPHVVSYVSHLKDRHTAHDLWSSMELSDGRS